TNSIIAVGSEARIKTVEELIALLDVPEGGLGEQKMMTFSLESVSPAQAATQLQSLFQNVEQARRPMVIPIADQSKITVVGPSSLLVQAVARLGEIDPSTKQGEQPRSASPERRATVVKLTYITPQTVEQIAPRLLTQRQLTVVKFGPTPDGKGVV